MIKKSITEMICRTYIGGREAEKSDILLPFSAPLADIADETEFSCIITLPETDDEGEYLLEFSGVSAKTDVYINDVFAGTHTGLFSRFRINITDFAVCGKENNVRVIVFPSERTDGAFVFGEITLLCVPVSHFELDNLGTGGITVRTAASENACNIHLKAPVKNPNNYDVVSFVMTSPDGEVFTKTCKPTDAECTFNITSPFIWGGQNEANLYHVKAYLQRDSVYLDEANAVFGIKRMRFKDRFFCLDELRLPLNGIELTDFKCIEEDIELFNQLDANCLMLNLLPHDYDILSECDKNGVVVWLDLTTAINKNNADELAEIIAQASEHPSVCFASCDGTDADFVKLFCDTVKEHSDSIFTAMKCSFPIEENESIALPDVLAFEISSSTTPDRFAALGNRLDEFYAEHPGYRIAVIADSPECIYSRHSTGAVRNDCSQEFFSLWHERLWNAFGTKKGVFAFFAGTLTDKGEKTQRMGLVTFDRDDKKDAFWFYKSQFSAEGFVKLCSGGITQSAEKYIDIKCYTNTPPINITVNGKNKKDYRSDETAHCVYEFRRIKLHRRNNTIVISAAGGTDSAVIFRSKSKLGKK